MVLEKVIEILADYKELDPATIKAESTLEELELDSLDTVELIMNFEDEFGCTIELNEQLKTVADIVALIESSKQA